MTAKTKAKMGLIQLAFIGALLTDAGLVSGKGPIVDLGYAQYQGDVDIALNITQYMNIRYAAPPTGDLRWQPPQPPLHVSGVQQADVQPPECYQAPTGAALTDPFASTNFRKRQTTQTEDCLYLEVDVPGTSWSNAKTGGLPVVVWIHGGGYVAGGAASYNGDDLILDAGGGVVVVVIQYRLGLFGFLSGNEVSGDGALNVGLLDQVFALEWVQKYIHLFGGDPTKVTIWGESAGAGSALQHIVANGGNTNPPLFRAAITSSLAMHAQYWYNDTVPETYFSQVADGTGCSGSSVMSCLRAADVNTLEDLNNQINADGFFGTYALGPVIDGSLILESPTKILLSGAHNGHAFMGINNQLEGFIFTSNATAASTNLTLYIHELFPSLTAAHVDNAASLYATYPGTIFDKAVAVIGEASYICPTHLLPLVFPDVSWKGVFAIPPAHHEQDIPYYFNDPGSTPPYANVDFRKAFAGSFLAFVKTLNPNLHGTTITPEWPNYGLDKTEMLFNSTNGTGTTSEPVVHTFTTDSDLLARCAFWRSVANETHQ